MTSPVTILLLPHDPKLLADGPGGSRAPVLCVAPEGHSPRAYPRLAAFSPSVMAPLQAALLLAHKGQVVEQARGWLPLHTWQRMERNIRHIIGYVEHQEDAAWWLCHWAKDLGTIIILDENGREVTP